MFKTLSIVAVAGLVLALAPVAQADILAVDFDSLATGAVTADALNGVTTGGTWNLNTGVSFQEIQVDSAGGTKALLSGSKSEGDKKSGPGATVTLTTAYAVSSLSAGETFHINFVTGSTVKTGWVLEPSWYLLDDLGGTLARMDLDDGTMKMSGGSGTVSLFGASDTVGTSWNSDSAYAITMSMTIDSAGLLSLYAEDADSSGTITKSIGTAAKISSLQTTWVPNKGQGVYITDLSMTAVPEPATMSLLALGGLSVIARRRRRA